MSLYCAAGSIESDLFPQLHDLLVESLAKLGQRSRVLVVPPDHSRVHSRSGELTRYAWEYYGGGVATGFSPVGAPSPLPGDQSKGMVGALSQERFRAP